MSAISGTSEAFESAVAPHYAGLVRRLTAVLRDPEARLGTRIAGAIEVDGRLVLVGERDRVATFWVGEQP